MFRRITFPNKLRCFEAGFSMEFQPGLNALVGDQGCGKSTLLDALCGIHPAEVEKDPDTRLKHFDFERYNPRLSTAFGDTIDLGVQLQVLHVSHGQSVVLMLADLCKRNVTKPHTFIFDEPDTGLSIRSCRVLGNFLQMAVVAGHQIIASVHNPIVIWSLGEVYSLEQRKLMTAKDFVDSQLAPSA